jgi:PilZ domain
MAEKRKIDRHSCFIRGEAVMPDGVTRIPVTVHDISDVGAKVITEEGVTLPEMIVLDLPRRHMRENARVVRRGDKDSGVIFVKR